MSLRRHFCDRLVEPGVRLVGGRTARGTAGTAVELLPARAIAVFNQTFRTELSRQSPEPINFFEVSIRPTPFDLMPREDLVVDYVRATTTAVPRLDLVVSMAATSAAVRPKVRGAAVSDDADHPGRGCAFHERPESHPQRDERRPRAGPAADDRQHTAGSS